MEDLTKILEGTNEVLKTVPQIYDDGAKNTICESGKLVARIPRFINALFSELDMWILTRENNVEAMKLLLEKKLENIDPDKIVPPEPYVTVPAIQAMSYSMDNEELKNMYANLLANAMNIDKKEEVHPSFVEIIKQMNPMDAQVFKGICKSAIQPMITLKGKFSEANKGQITMARHITWIADDYKYVCRSLDNLARCRLIELLEDKHYVLDSHYDCVRKQKHYIDIKEKLLISKDPQIIDIVEQKGIIIITDIGYAFFDICVK